MSIAIETKSIKEFGYENVMLVASFDDNDFDFKNMYIAKFGNQWRFVQCDIDMHSNMACATGESYTSKQQILAASYDYLIDIWGFKDHEIKEEVKKAHKLAAIGFEITKEELGAVKFARDRFAQPDQSEMAEINAYYLSKLLKKLEGLI